MAVLFFAALAVLLLLDELPVIVLAVYGLVSAITFGVYRHDKSAALTRRWRTPEMTLHTLALLGGWPGALVAQQVLRHKTTKQPFRTVFWGTVILNCAALTWLIAQGFTIP